MSRTRTVVTIDLKFCPCREPNNMCDLADIPCAADDLASMIRCPMRLHAETTVYMDEKQEEQEEND